MGEAPVARSRSPQASNSARIRFAFLGQDAVHRAPPGWASASRPAPRQRSQRCARRSGSSSTRHASRTVQPACSAPSTKAGGGALEIRTIGADIGHGIRPRPRN